MAVRAEPWNLDVLPFLAGGGEMGALIRTLDWVRTPLGSPEAWPQSLRTVVRLMLTTNHPMFVFWGPEHICLYNDAYRASIGPEKHPAMLGSRGRDMWGEIWDIIGPQIDKVMTGEGATWHEDQLVPIYRHGALDDVYWTYSYGPIDDEGAPNGVGGVLVICTETTSRVLAAQRLAFLNDLDRTLSDISDAAAVVEAATAALGRHLKVGRCGYGEVDESGMFFDVERDWTDGRMRSLAGRQPLGDLGRDVVAELNSARPVRLEDVRTDARAASLRDAQDGAVNMRACLVVPLMQGGRLAGALYVHQVAPRRWSDHEELLIRQVAERVWSRVARARVDSERARLAALVAASHEFIGIADLEGNALFVNEAGRKLVGLADLKAVQATRVLDYFAPDDRPTVIDQVMPSVRDTGFWQGELRFRHFETGELLPVRYNIFPVRDVSGAIVAYGTVTRDLIETKAAERHRDLLINELNHRVKNTLAIVQALASQTFRNDVDMDQARKVFSARLVALSRAHDVLTQANWDGANLGDVTVHALAPFQSDSRRIRSEGPSVRITPQQTLAFSMVFYELATNAVKYGALSNDSGIVTVSWDVRDAAGRPTLQLIWSEQGGPPVRPPTHRGFGSRLIERSLGNEQGGEVALDYRASGLVCTLSLSLGRH